MATAPKLLRYIQSPHGNSVDIFCKVSYILSRPFSEYRPVTRKFEEADLRSKALARILYGVPGDYLLCAVLGSAPLVTAWYAQVFHTAGAYEGYAQTQWRWWPLLLPVVLWIVRVLWQRIVPINPSDAGVVTLFHSRQQAAASLEARTLNRTNLYLALIIGAVLSVVDAQDVLNCYINPSCTPLERDWSVMFLERPDIERANLYHVATAYTIQGIAIVFGVLLVVVCVCHNAFFVSSIYQRRRQRSVPDCVVVDFDDTNDRFGFGAAHKAFNAQVVLLILAAPVFLLTRLPNTRLQPHQLGRLSEAIEGLAELKVGAFLGTLSALPLFPDIGQKILLGAWVFMLFVVTIPAIVKFLPVLTRPPRLDIEAFLLEFIPESTANARNAKNAANIRELAKDFARNSMWPTGDGAARLLFFFAFFVLGWLIVPLPFTTPLNVFVQFIVSLGIAAGSAVIAVLFVLKYLLAGVNLNLVKAKD